MSFPTPPATVSDFKAFFTRDFTYGSTTDTVMDADITKALNEASMMFNAELFDGTSEQQYAYLYLSAHCLVVAVRYAGGLGSTKIGMNSTGSAPIASKSAGPLSVGYALSQRVTENPVLAQFLATGYGMKYLSLVEPQLKGNMSSVAGATQP